MGSRSEAVRRCWANLRLRRALDVVTVDRRTLLTTLAGTPDSRVVAEDHAFDHYR